MFSSRPAPSPRSLSSSLSSIVASSPLVSSAMLWLSALAARCRWAAASCTTRLVSPRSCPPRSGCAGGSPRCPLGGSECCRCWRASRLPPRTGFGAKCDYARYRCPIAARFSLRGRGPVYSLLSTARSRARQIAVSVRSPNSNVRAGDRCVAERIASYVSTDGSARACGVSDCTCKVSTKNGPRETSGPRIDRIPPARPPWWRRHYRDIK